MRGLLGTTRVLTALVSLLASLDVHAWPNASPLKRAPRWTAEQALALPSVTPNRLTPPRETFAAMIRRLDEGEPQGEDDPPLNDLLDALDAGLWDHATQLYSDMTDIAVESAQDRLWTLRRAESFPLFNAVGRCLAFARLLVALSPDTPVLARLALRRIARDTDHLLSDDNATSDKLVQWSLFLHLLQAYSREHFVPVAPDYLEEIVIRAKIALFSRDVDSEPQWQSRLWAELNREWDGRPDAAFADAAALFLRHSPYAADVMSEFMRHRAWADPASAGWIFLLIREMSFRPEWTRKLLARLSDSISDASSRQQFWLGLGQAVSRRAHADRSQDPVLMEGTRLLMGWVSTQAPGVVPWLDPSGWGYRMAIVDKSPLVLSSPDAVELVWRSARAVLWKENYRWRLDRPGCHPLEMSSNPVYWNGCRIEVNGRDVRIIPPDSNEEPITVAYVDSGRRRLLEVISDGDLRTARHWPGDHEEVNALIEPAETWVAEAVRRLGSVGPVLWSRRTAKELAGAKLPLLWQICLSGALVGFIRELPIGLSSSPSPGPRGPLYAALTLLSYRLEEVGFGPPLTTELRDQVYRWAGGSKVLPFYLLGSLLEFQIPEDRSALIDRILAQWKNELERLAKSPVELGDASHPFVIRAKDLLLRTDEEFERRMEGAVKVDVPPGTELRFTPTMPFALHRPDRVTQFKRSAGRWAFRRGNKQHKQGDKWPLWQTFTGPQWDERTRTMAVANRSGQPLVLELGRPEGRGTQSAVHRPDSMKVTIRDLETGDSNEMWIPVRPSWPPPDVQGVFGDSFSFESAPPALRQST